MQKITREIDVLKQLFENLSEQDKQQFLLDVSKSKSTLQKIIQPRKISCCPHCQSIRFVKNGKTDGNQRYLCKECGKTFVGNTGTILFSMKYEERYCYTRKVCALYD